MNKFLPKIIFSLLAAQILLIFVSWVLDAMQWCEVNSLLSASGIRWFLSTYSDNMASPVLIWILLVACAYGAIKHSVASYSQLSESKTCGELSLPRVKFILSQSKGRRQNSHHIRERRGGSSSSVRISNMARIVVIILAAIILIALLLLTIVPHAILLSVTGNFYPSPFSDSIIPILCCSTIFLSWIHGSIIGTITSIQSAFESLILGIRTFAPLIILYLFITHFCYSVIYVLG